MSGSNTGNESLVFLAQEDDRFYTRFVQPGVQEDERCRIVAKYFPCTCCPVQQPDSYSPHLAIPPDIWNCYSEPHHLALYCEEQILAALLPMKDGPKHCQVCLSFSVLFQTLLILPFLRRHSNRHPNRNTSLAVFGVGLLRFQSTNLQRANHNEDSRIQLGI
jgi:hypothetical protein